MLENRASGSARCSSRLASRPVVRERAGPRPAVAGCGPRRPSSRCRGAGRRPPGARWPRARDHPSVRGLAPQRRGERDRPQDAGRARRCPAARSASRAPPGTGSGRRAGTPRRTGASRRSARPAPADRAPRRISKSSRSNHSPRLWATSPCRLTRSNICHSWGPPRVDAAPGLGRGLGGGIQVTPEERQAAAGHQQRRRRRAIRPG